MKLMKPMICLSLVLLIDVFLIFTASPAFASTTVSISGNSSGSKNSANVTVNQSTTILQSNFLTIFNKMFGLSSTGNNTGSGGSITTGNAITQISVTTSGNNNFASVPCRGDVPQVPEFGVIPGTVALLTSGGIFFYLKKRHN